MSHEDIAKNWLSGVEIKKQNNWTQEIGGTGLPLRSGQALYEDYLPELRGLQGVRKYREMSLTPIVGAILFTIEQMLQKVTWTVKPASEDPQDKEAADFVEGCRNDMNQSWADVLGEISTFLTYGWAWHEIVYKLRRGRQTRGDLATSKFGDGKIGWRKWGLRGQDTLSGWILDDNGGIKAMEQELSTPTYKKVQIPIEKSLLFRTRVERNNPEGLSILRRAYDPYYHAKRFQSIEAIGIERDLAGLPVLTPPENLDLWNTKDSNAVLLKAKCESLITSIRRGEQEGLLKPHGWTLELLTANSRRQFDVEAIIAKRDMKIALTCLADFIFLGQQNVGSWSLASEKTKMFMLALAGFLRRIVEVVNRHAIPTLMELNGFKPEQAPALEHGDVETQNLAEMAQYLTALSNAGAIMFPDEGLERYLRMIAGWPEPPENPEPPLEPNPPPPDNQPPEIQMKRDEIRKAVNELGEMMRAQGNGAAS